MSHVVSCKFILYSLFLILSSSFNVRYQKPTESPPTDGSTQAAKGGSNSAAVANSVKVGVAAVVGVTAMLF